MGRRRRVWPAERERVHVLRPALLRAHAERRRRGDPRGRARPRGRGGKTRSRRRGRPQCGRRRRRRPRVRLALLAGLDPAAQLLVVVHGVLLAELGLVLGLGQGDRRAHLPEHAGELPPHRAGALRRAARRGRAGIGGGRGGVAREGRAARVRGASGGGGGGASAPDSERAHLSPSRPSRVEGVFRVVPISRFIGSVPERDEGFVVGRRGRAGVRARVRDESADDGTVSLAVHAFVAENLLHALVEHLAESAEQRRRRAPQVAQAKPAERPARVPAQPVLHLARELREHRDVDRAVARRSAGEELAAAQRLGNRLGERQRLARRANLRKEPGVVHLVRLERGETHARFRVVSRVGLARAR
mmetsp:Transcript_14245/g.60998  ORF Transcript_14245/g.60998 Transcript_14245/m.60998 type:complete len:360 (-) Transcript_14245:1700-2779(-)